MQRPVASNVPCWKGYEWRQSIKNDCITAEERASYEALQTFLQDYHVPEAFPIDIATLQEISHFCVYLQMQNPLSIVPPVLNWADHHIRSFLALVFGNPETPNRSWRPVYLEAPHLPFQYKRKAIRTYKSEGQRQEERCDATQYNVVLLKTYARMVIHHKATLLNPQLFRFYHPTFAAERISNLPTLCDLRAALQESYFHLTNSSIPAPTPLAVRLKGAVQLSIDDSSPSHAPVRSTTSDSPLPKRIKCATSISVLAGLEQKHFRVHQKVICAESDFFTAACSGSWRENQNRLVELPEIEPHVLGRYIHWAYTGELNMTALSDEIGADDSGLPWRLLELYLAAQFLLNIRLQDEIVDCLWCALLQPSAARLQPSFIEATWAETKPGCGLQRLILETFTIENSSYGREFIVACGVEFSFDLIQEGLRSKERFERISDFDLEIEACTEGAVPDPWKPLSPTEDLDQCRYHEHHTPLDGSHCELPVLINERFRDGKVRWHLV